jgi:hypothetical protein
MRCLKRAHKQAAFPVGQRDLAREFVEFGASSTVRTRAGYLDLCTQWLAELGKSAHWVLGCRDPARALPTERLWGGVPTVAGQMLLLPIAALFPGEPTAAYEAAYALGFIDNGPGKDITAALVAGLASALTLVIRPEAPEEAWASVRRAMIETDPYGYAHVPWVERKVAAWLGFAIKAADRADHRPARLFRLLERGMRAQTYWEAHVPLVTSFAFIHLSGYRPLAAMELALAFGHDTDSDAQLLGAFVGAIHGTSVFPKAMRDQVAKRFQADYDESISAWVELLETLRDRERYPKLIQMA